MSLSKIIGCVKSGSGISGWNARLCPLSFLCARACGSLLDLYLWLELESGSTLKSTLSYISATSVIGNPTSNTETRSRNPEAVIILVWELSVIPATVTGMAVSVRRPSRVFQGDNAGGSVVDLRFHSQRYHKLVIPCGRTNPCLIYMETKTTAKAKRHKRGTADTAWNLFGREYMAEHRPDSILLRKQKLSMVRKFEGLEKPGNVYISNYYAWRWSRIMVFHCVNTPQPEKVPPK
ncbi:hypothetical protein B0H14DRAFT_2643565 [Mycena olivaceomarginata]|nr:hypothetical protein B0H14DRAFT_2643565 [Mycena olivaceomarginata]